MVNYHYLNHLRRIIIAIFLGQEKERMIQGEHSEIFICTHKVRAYKELFRQKGP